MTRRFAFYLLLLIVTLSSGSYAGLDVDRYGKLGEAERFDFDRAEEQLKAQRWVAAKNEFSKFIKLYPKSVAAPYAQLMIGYCEEQGRYVNEAMKTYQQVRDYFPDSPEAPLALSWIARCHDANGDPEKAMPFWSQVIKEYPDHLVCIDALWRLVQYHVEKKMASSAADEANKIIDKYPPFHQGEQYGNWWRAGEWLVRYYALDEDNPEAAIAAYVKFRSKYLQQHDRWDEAGAKKQAFQEAQGFVARVYRDAANWHRSQQHAPEAKKYYDRAMKLYEQMGAVVEQAWFNREFGRHQDAVDALILYLAKNEKDDGTRVNFGHYLEELQKWEDARGQYAKMNDQNYGLCETAESYWRQRKGKECVEAFKLLAEKDMGRYAYALYRIGDAYLYLLGDPAKALNAYKESFYGETQYLFQIAECYRQLKKYDQALNQLKEIASFFQNAAPQAYWRMVPIFHERNEARDMDRCIAVCRRICNTYKTSGESSAAHQHLEDAHKVSVTGGGEKGTTDEEELLKFGP